MEKTKPMTREEFTASITKHLNEEQIEAVTYPRQSYLVLAGAGSGKTTVITGRIAYLINEGIPADKMMAVTFTNKSSEEMKKRLSKKLSYSNVNAIWAGTFHSLCNRMLREQYFAAGLPRNFAILDTDGQESLVRTLTKDVNDALAADAQENDPDSKPEKIQAKDVVRYINSKKEFGIRPDQIHVEFGSWDLVMVELYRAYQTACHEQELLDFNDLLYRTVQLLEANPEVRDYYRSQFEAILVDEFQDTNNIQYRWLQLLTGPKTFVTAVGDDDQSIYAFRGANPGNMQNFVRQMTVTPANPQGVVIKLQRNYRSLPYILESANAVISRNADRLGKNLWTDAPDRGEKIAMTTFDNAIGEAVTIAKEIHSLIRNQGVKPNEVAILYRTNMQSRLLEQELNKLSVPLTVYGGFRFFDRQEIKQILCYMDLISSFQRDISFSRIINFPLRGLGEKTIEDLRQEAKENGVSMFAMIGLRVQNGSTAVQTSAGLKKQRVLESFAEMMLDLAELAQKVPLSELVSTLVTKTGIRAFYESQPADEATERLENIEELISASRQFEIDHPELTNAAQQLPEYLGFVQLMTSTSEADMDKKNTVSLMTVHASKGLEFDHVYIAGMEEGIFPHARSMTEKDFIEMGPDGTYPGGIVPEFDDDGNLTEESFEAISAAREAMSKTATGLKIDTPEIQEERRLMYVALTRARKSLKLSRAEVRMNNGEEHKARPSRFIAEIPHSKMILVRDKTPRFGYVRQATQNAQTDMSDGVDPLMHSTPSAPAQPPVQATVAAIKPGRFVPPQSKKNPTAAPETIDSVITKSMFR